MFLAINEVTRVVSWERSARSPQIITVRVNIAELGEVSGCGRVEKGGTNASTSATRQIGSPRKGTDETRAEIPAMKLTYPSGSRIPHATSS